MLSLYDYFRSSASYRVRIALNLKQLDYKAIPIHLVKNGGEQHSERYQSINPQSLVPALQDGDHIITQSLAIMEYLEEMHPTPSLLPGNAFEKAQIRSFALSIIADSHPLNNLRVLTYLTNDLHVSDEQKNQWYQHWMQLGMHALEKKLLANRASTEFCFGNTPTVADVCLVPHMYNARRFNCDLRDYPTLVRIDAACQKLPAFAKATPEQCEATLQDATQ